jgi:UDP-perosamine 4-acetyltransferase
MKILLVACGGHGRVVLDTALSLSMKVDGIIDNLPTGNKIFEIPILGGDTYLETLNTSDYLLLNGFGFTKSTELRKTKYSEWIRFGFAIIGVVHPSVVIGRECNIDSTSQIMAGVVIQNRTHISENTILNTRCSIDHDVKIGKHCFISPSAIICGGAKIGDEVFIGSGSVILPNVEIGSGSLITAGSVVRASLPTHSRFFEKKD